MAVARGGARGAVAPQKQIGEFFLTFSLSGVLGVDSLIVMTVLLCNLLQVIRSS